MRSSPVFLAVSIFVWISRSASFNLQQATLEAERARLATVLEQMTDGVLIADSQGLIQFANPAVGKLFQTSNPINRSLTEVIRNHQLVEAWRRCQQTRELQSETVEVPIRHQFLQLVVIPDSHASGSLLLVQDLTRVRRLENVRRDFVSNLSHELRTPLASLKALAETLQDGALDDPPAARRFIDQIQIEVDALTQMVTELLELSKIESGSLSLDLQPASVSELLSSASRRMQLQAERAGLNLRVECANDLPKVKIDSHRLEQVLVNLIHNAVKFTRSGGEVVLAADIAGIGEVRFAVRDSGIGIPADDVTRIFERFYRVDKSRTGSGTGLGLSIAKHIVEAHGERIWAESGPGRGATFTFTIPATAAEPPAGAPQAASSKLTNYVPSEERTRGAWAYLNDLHEKKLGIYYLARVGLDIKFHLYLKGKAIQSADLKGLNIRVSPLYLQAIKGLGGNPVVIPPTETYVALERNVVDGYGWPAVGIRDWGWQKHTQYVLEPGFYQVPNPLLVNLKTWNQLPQKLKDVLKDAPIEAEKRVVASFSELEKQERPLLLKEGIQVIELPPAEKEKFLKLTYESAWEDILKKCPDTGPKLKELLSKKK